MSDSGFSAAVHAEDARKRKRDIAACTAHWDDLIREHIPLGE